MKVVQPEGDLSQRSGRAVSTRSGGHAEAATGAIDRSDLGDEGCGQTQAGLTAAKATRSTTPHASSTTGHLTGDPVPLAVDCADVRRLRRLAALAGTVDKLTAAALLMGDADGAVDDQLRLLDEVAGWLVGRLTRNEAAV